MMGNPTLKPMGGVMTSTLILYFHHGNKCFYALKFRLFP